MKFTAEQYDIIHSSGDINVCAVAGSGKTTTLIAYAKSRPATSRILYLAFNRSVRKEASRKFMEEGLSNVRVETAHSLAYRHVVPAHRYTVRNSTYRVSELADILDLGREGEKHARYILASHINRYSAYFCNSAADKVSALDYLETVRDPVARAFVSDHRDEIIRGTRVFLGKMDRGEIDVTHDFYLKKFQLARPSLPFDYILFDEGQDASEAMLDVFLRQESVKVIVGDSHQQIYGWRFAVNSLEKTGFPALGLSVSFRFDQHLADLALRVLAWKNHLAPLPDVRITGRGTPPEPVTRALVARSNLGLLLHAIRYTTECPDARPIYFEGNISSYTYAAEGASLYDVLNLYEERYKAIRDPVIRSMRDLDDLQEYVTRTGDAELGTMLAIVSEFGSEVPELIAAVREKHVSDNRKQDAGLIFSTVHRCKGMEYDAVQLADDFVSEDKLLELKEGETGELDRSRLIEEINLLYVAVTRTRSLLYIPEQLCPRDMAASAGIRILKKDVHTGGMNGLV